MSLLLIKLLIGIIVIAVYAVLKTMEFFGVDVKSARETAQLKKELQQILEDNK